MTSIALIVLTVACLVAMATFAAISATDRLRFLYVLVALIVVGPRGMAAWVPPLTRQAPRPERTGGNVVALDAIP